MNSKRFFAPLWLLILGTANDLRSTRDVNAQFTRPVVVRAGAVTDEPQAAERAAPVDGPLWVPGAGRALAALARPTRPALAESAWGASRLQLLQSRPGARGS